LAGFLRTGNRDLICDGGFTRTPSGGAESITTAAAPNPRLTKSWVKVPPKEWPMMIGGRSKLSTTSLRWSSVAGTDASAMTSGLSRNASTSISNPGYVGTTTSWPFAR
jgi:hypothetical protein